MPKKTLLILDGHAVLHRAWHALPSMTSTEGQEVRGAYGFTTMLLNAIKEFKPEYVVVAQDLPGPTFRHDSFEQYKAQREAKPDELYQQIDVINDILAAMKIPVLTAKRYEADDVIGTVTKLSTEQDKDIENIIATGDQDSFQLVDKSTRVWMPRRRDGKTVMTLIDAKAVKEDFGFEPKTLIDYKALRGDSSDNIPGVRGIGEVSAKKLLLEFKSVPALYAALHKGGKKVESISEKTRELLMKSEKEAMHALDLCTIRRDAPVKLDLEAAAYKRATREEVTPVFTRLGFMRLLQQFATAATPVKATGGTLSMFGAATASAEGAAPAAGKDYTEIHDADGLGKAMAALAKPVKTAFRFLTDNDPYAPQVLALALSDGKKSWIVTKAAFAAGKPLLATYFGGTGEKVCHDLKKSLKVLDAAGIPAGPVLRVGKGAKSSETGASAETTSERYFDIMIASYLLEAGERKHDLGALLGYKRGVQLDDIKVDAELTDDVIKQKIARLAVEIPHLLPLAEAQEKELKDKGLVKLNDTIGLPLAPVLAKMERSGVAVDVDYLSELGKDLGKRIAKLVTEIHKHGKGEFNINSPTQLKEVLFDKLEISPLGMKKTATGGTLSTAAAELEKLRDKHPIVGKVLEYRELTKLKSTYVDALPEYVHKKTGRIHAEFNQTVAATGRLSSQYPNLQNIPTPETEDGKKVRNAFVAPRGKTLVSADYSQFELRIVAHIANEPVMIKAFKEGLDIHKATATQMFGADKADEMRRVAKAINFGILYGMGPQRLAEQTDLSFLEAKQFIDKYFAMHKGITKYVADTQEKIADDGFSETMFGRKRFFKNVRLMNPRERAEAERQAVNMPVQGTQADVIQLVMIKLDAFISEKYPEGEVKLISQVHDELLFEVSDDVVQKFVPQMKKIMNETVTLVVPVVVNVATGKKWGNLKDLD